MLLGEVTSEPGLAADIALLVVVVGVGAGVCEGIVVGPDEAGIVDACVVVVPELLLLLDEGSDPDEGVVLNGPTAELDGEELG